MIAEPAGTSEPEQEVPDSESEAETIIIDADDAHTVVETDLTEEETSAAIALMRLHKDSAHAMRRLINTHHGHLGRAVMTILRQATHHPLTRPKTPDQITRDDKHQQRKQNLHAALTLTKLNGESTTENIAALTLLKLRTEAKLTLLRARQARAVAQKAARQRKWAAEQFVAMEKFRRQYPAVLRTSGRVGGERLPRPRGSSLYVVMHGEE